MRTFNMNLSWISNHPPQYFFWPRQSTLFFFNQLSVHEGNLTWWRLSIYPASKSSSKASGPSGSGIVYPMVTAPVSDNHSESEISHGGWELERQPLVFFLTPKQSLASRAEAAVFPTQWISDHFSDIRLANVSAVSLQKNCIFRCYCIADTDSGQTKSYLDVVDHCTVVGWWTCQCCDASGGLCPW